MNRVLAEWLGNRLEALTKAVRKHCDEGEERRRKHWPLEIDGLPRGALVDFEGGTYELLDDTMTKQRSFSNDMNQAEQNNKETKG